MTSRKIVSFVLATLASVSVFVPASTYADYFDVGGWEDSYGDLGGWEDSYSDLGGWEDSYGDLGGWEDPYSDLGGWEDSYGDLGGWEDSYSDLGGWDGGYGDVGGWSGGYSDVGGYTPTYYSGSSGERYYSSGSSYYPSSSYGGSGYSYSQPRSYSTPTYYSTPITVSSGHSYVQPSTPVVTTPIHNTNNNNNVNNNTNINNVSATAIAIAPAPVAAPVAMYIPPAPVHPAPYCTISIVNHYGAGYGYGQQTLTWNSTNAHSASISPIVGGVTTNGSRVITNTLGQVYTMTVWGPGGSATCQTQPMYVPPVVTPTPYVSLSQIPYTGFDFGPVGNAMYWLSLISLALGGAYFLLYFKGGALAFAGSMMSGRENAARQARLAEFTPLPESAFAPAKTVQKVSVAPRVGTLDSMSFTRTTTGAPTIVIKRA